jgi:beta-lactamase class A
MRKLINLVLILILAFLLLRAYSRFKVHAAPIPPGVHLAGLDLSALKNTEEIRTHLMRIYAEPVAVYFADERLWLEPAAVDFQLDVDQMVWEASQYMDGGAFIDIAVREAVGIPQQQRNIEPRFTVDHEKLRNWLQTVAMERNRPPQLARVVPPSDKWTDSMAAAPSLPVQIPADFVGTYTRDWQWTTGSPGYELDMEASIPALIQGLTQREERSARLVVRETPPPLPSMADLEEALDSYLSNFPGFAAVYVQDLATGQEVNVDADVSFSGMSTLKIGIVSAAMQRLNGIEKDDEVAYEVGQWIDFALGESNNYAANLLVRWLGNGDTTAGTQAFTNFMHQLGFENSYMQSGYDAQTQLPEIPTPGNQREDWNTNPDSNLQSTPTEMGRLLAAIYRCTQGEGLFIETFGSDLTSEECRYILFYMSHDQFQEMLWSGLPRPNEAWIVHKHGFAFESHSDVALVWGPTGPYVISLFLYRSGWMDWETSNSTMKDVSRITWNFFEFQAQHSDDEPPPPLELTPPPGYVPVNDYVPAS